MPARTNIGWADYSSNPVRARYTTDDGVAKLGWACVLASAGCLNCYAASMNRRLGTGLDYSLLNMKLDRVEVYLDEKELQRMLRFRPKPTIAHDTTIETPPGARLVIPREVRHTPLTYKNGRSRPIVFVGDMTDLFGWWVTDEMLDRLFAVMALRPDVDWLLLTKRPERMREYLCDPETAIRIADAKYETHYGRAWLATPPGWPLPNVGLGVSVENQAELDRRIPDLLATPAAWRFISAEPLLGPLDLDPYLNDLSDGCRLAPHGINWVVVGAESGPKRRRCEVEWIEDIVRQCDAARVHVFVKQDSALRPGQQGRIPDDLWARKEVPGMTEKLRLPYYPRLRDR